MKYSFLIVDDETLSRDYIRDLITEFMPGAAIMEAASGKAALRALEENKPDILFLDVKMPDMDGFTVLESVKYRDFELVFITAYSEFAIKAFKEGACDYILKPIKKSEFKETLEKTIVRRKKELEQRQLDSKKIPVGKLIINHQHGIKIVDIKDIVFLEADNTYTTIYLADDEKIVTSKPIHHFEKTLDSHWFFRIHKSHMINLLHFKEYISKNEKMVLLSNGSRLHISRYRLNEFMQKIKSVTGHS